MEGEREIADEEDPRQCEYPGDREQADRGDQQAPWPRPLPNGNGDRGTRDRLERCV
jgi:hypothetical protein